MFVHTTRGAGGAYREPRCGHEASRTATARAPCTPRTETESDAVMDGRRAAGARGAGEPRVGALPGLASSRTALTACAARGYSWRSAVGRSCPGRPARPLARRRRRRRPASVLEQPKPGAMADGRPNGNVARGTPVKSKPEAVQNRGGWVRAQRRQRLDGGRGVGARRRW